MSTTYIGAKRKTAAESLPDLVALLGVGGFANLTSAFIAGTFARAFQRAAQWEAWFALCVLVVAGVIGNDCR